MAEIWWRTPTALTAFSLGTAGLSALALMILTKRAEKAGWTHFSASTLIFSVGAASALNLLFASTLKGKA